MTDGPRNPLDQLQTIARALDEQAPPVTVAEALRTTAPTRPRSYERLALTAAAALLIVIVGAGVWAAIGDRDEHTSVVTPGPGSTQSAPSTTTEGVPASDFEWSALPAVGIAIQPLDGPLELYDLEGTPLGVAPALVAPVNSPRLVVWPGQVEEEPSPLVEVPDGCESAESGGGLRVALCGGADGLPRRVELVDATGEATLLLDGPPRREGLSDVVVGHWRWATPSPDGKWVLAQWSGECEVPTAFLINAATGDARTVDGTSLDDWANAPTSVGLGWAQDGRAVVSLPEAACGSGAEIPGTHVLDPATGVLDRVLPSGELSDQTFLWIKRAHGNGAEWLVGQAIASLGLEGCCGEPSQGGAGVTYGATFEGHDIGILGQPTAGPGADLPATDGQRLPVLHGEAVVFPNTPGGPFPGSSLVAFRCGDFTWVLSWWDDGTPEVDSMLLLAETLVPHLACTLGEPPGS